LSKTTVFDGGAKIISNKMRKLLDAWIHLATKY